MFNFFKKGNKLRSQAIYHKDNLIGYLNHIEGQVIDKELAWNISHRIYLHKISDAHFKASLDREANTVLLDKLEEKASMMTYANEIKEAEEDILVNFKGTRVNPKLILKHFEGVTIR